MLKAAKDQGQETYKCRSITLIPDISMETLNDRGPRYMFYRD